MQANDAMKILGSAAAMGLLGGSGALAYNAISKPTLDEYGNTIESNDINPFVAALGGAAIGAVGGGIYGKMNPASVTIPEEYLGTFRTQTKPIRQVRFQKEIDNLRNEIAITRQGIEEYKKTRKIPDFRTMSDDEFKEFYRNKSNYYIPSWNDKKYINTRMGDIAAREHIEPQVTGNLSQPQQSPMVVEPEVMPSQKMPILESVAEQTRFVPQLSSEQEALYADAKKLGISPYELEKRGWKYNPNQATIQVVPASPMQMQNPMARPGMRTVVIQRMKEPGQEMIEEALRLKELARRQRQQKQFDAVENMSSMGWNATQNRWLSPNASVNQQNAAGWDVMTQPGTTRKALNEASDEERYQDWLLSMATQEAQKKRG